MDKTFKDWFTLTGQPDNQKAIFHEAYLLGRNTRRTTRGPEKKESNHLFAACVHFWLKEFHPDWVGFNGGEGKALKEIIVKMDKYFFNANEKSPDEEQVLNFFKHFCVSLPEFYKSKTLKILNQNFDGIITEIRTKRRPGIDNSRPSAYDIIHAL